MKRILFVVCLSLLMLQPVLLNAEQTEVLYTATVTKDMTIRQKQSTSATKLGEVHAGETVQVIEFDDKWCDIVKDEVRGYILIKNVTDFVCAGGYDDEAQADYCGTAIKQLAVRAKKNKSAVRLQTIEEGQSVYVTSLEGKWLGVVCRGIHGYVLTEPVRDLRALREGILLPEEYATLPLFEAKYTAVTDLNLYIRKSADENAAVLGTANEGERIEVMSVDDKWALIQKGKTEGYVLSGHLKHYRRTDPFGDIIPGARIYPSAAHVLKPINLFDAESGEWLSTLPTGSVIAIDELQSDGSVTLPYHRVTARITDTSSLKLEEVVLWNEAQSGELLSVFSTYYDAAPDSTIQMGRIYNIQEGIRRINNTTIHSNETFSFNDLCAPYTKGNGYELGPIINYVSSQKTGYSGGICQVSTTLYNAALQMPFDVVKQQPHSSYGVFYVPVDMDAAVGAGNLDLRLRNVLPYDIRIEAQATEGVLTVRVYRV